jgi:hypothetical protein
VKNDVRLRVHVPLRVGSPGHSPSFN